MPVYRLLSAHSSIETIQVNAQFSLTRTPLELEQAPQDFLQLYNTTAHQGLLHE
jgi:hypothetical protein